MPNDCNVPGRTIFAGDNLGVLSGVNLECIDLIDLGPPFKPDQIYAASPDSEAQGAEFDLEWDFATEIARLNAMWSYLKRMQDWSQPGLERLREPLTALFAYTQYSIPNTPGVKGNWLADYADVYRYDANQDL